MKLQIVVPCYHEEMVLPEAARPFEARRRYRDVNPYRRGIRPEPPHGGAAAVLRRDPES